MAKIKRIHRTHAHKHPIRPKGIGSRAFERVYWPYLPLVLIIGLMLSFGTRNNALQGSVSHVPPAVLSYADSMNPTTLLADTNVQRAKIKIPPLSFSSQLDAAAQSKANDMISRNYWSHETPEGSPPWIFVTSQSYSYSKLGENLAAGFDDELSTIDGWMASQTHRQNMLDPKFSQAGFGVAKSPNYTSAGGGPMTVVVAFYAQPQAAGAGFNGTVKGALTPSKTSHAQLALASLPIAGVATDLMIVILAATIIVWLSRHVRSLRRAVKKGENFAFSHPLFDLGLLIIVVLSYLLSRTAGLIQ